MYAIDLTAQQQIDSLRVELAEKSTQLAASRAQVMQLSEHLKAKKGELNEDYAKVRTSVEGGGRLCASFNQDL